MDYQCISLYTGGAAGFDVAAEEIGWQTMAMVEIDSFCQSLLKQNFPHAATFGDIAKFTYSAFKSYCRKRGILNRSINIIFGGWPCQPWSIAGHRKGSSDERHGWPETFRIIKEFRPGGFVGENVPGIITTENHLDTVVADLESIGYTVRPFVISHYCVGAKFDGKRVFIVATADSERRSALRRYRQFQPASKTAGCGNNNRGRTAEPFTRERRQIEPRPYGVADGVSNRVDRNKAIGNAVDPFLVYQIFQALETIIDL